MTSLEVKYNYLFRFFLYSVFNEHCANFCSLVGPSGLEPPTSCLSGTRSNLLSYDPSRLVFGVSLGLVEMMGFGRSANYALWSPSALTVHRTVIHSLLCSNPKIRTFKLSI